MLVLFLSINFVIVQIYIYIYVLHVFLAAYPHLPLRAFARILTGLHSLLAFYWGCA